MNTLPETLEAYPFKSEDKIRYGDCDAMGHVNNAVFSTFLETGRVEVLMDDRADVLSEDCGFVIVRLELDYMGEVRWPGKVQTGTGVLSVNSSSVAFGQMVFQDGKPVARAKSVIVQMNKTTRKSQRLSDFARERFKACQLEGVDA